MRPSTRPIVATLGVIICLLAAESGNAQVIQRGTVFSVAEGDTLPLPHAHVRLAGSTKGTIADESGRFSLELNKGEDALLIVSHVGFESDTIRVEPGGTLAIVVYRIHTFDEVSVSGERKATSIAPIEIKTEVISRKELLKAPCCDLSGCFSTNTSVEPAVTDVIVDTKELRMIGLSGVYTQILLDNVPSLMTGLNHAHGLSALPGTLIDRIYVVKGINSVLQGYDAISGQVNVLLRDRNDPESFHLNSFANSMLEKLVTGYMSASVGSWHTLIAAHTAQPGRDFDADGNRFLDAPRVTRYGLYNKWELQNDDNGFLTRGAVSYFDEERVGGQSGFDPASNPATAAIYGQTIVNRRLQFYDKSEILIPDAGKLNVHVAAGVHRQESRYGATLYDATQRQAYGDVAYVHPVSEEHTLTTGASFSWMRIAEEIGFTANPLGKTYAGSRADVESVPGIFVEDKFRFFDDMLTVIAGLRADFHNTMGTFFTPRLFAKLDPLENTVLRFSIGTGSRHARIFSENTSLLASWRDIVVDASLRRESALNIGGSLTQYYAIAGLSGALIIDAYQTRFTGQVIADYDSDPSRILFRNLDVPSVANHLLVELTQDVTDELDLKTAYAFTDAYEDRADGHRTIPFRSRHSFLGFASWDIPAIDASLNASFEWHGPQRLPDTRSYPVEYQIPRESEAFSLVQMQFTKFFAGFELYMGVENLFDFRQRDPITNAAHPFERYFEPGFAWGPTKGRELFAGFRIRVLREEEADTGVEE
jgi:outer membrane receptor for ferrienterochelin and colicins